MRSSDFSILLSRLSTFQLFLSNHIPLCSGNFSLAAMPVIFLNLGTLFLLSLVTGTFPYGKKETFTQQWGLNGDCSAGQSFSLHWGSQPWPQPPSPKAVFFLGPWDQSLSVSISWVLSPPGTILHLGLSEHLLCLLQHGMHICNPAQRKCTVIYPIMEVNDGVAPSHSHSNPFRIFLSFLIPSYLPIQQHQKFHQEICSFSAFP